VVWQFVVQQFDDWQFFVWQFVVQQFVDWKLRQTQMYVPN
jgi:hypothetical protein